jgi:O-antigen ligase
MASFAATAALWSTVLFVPVAIIQLGRYVVLRVMVAAMAIFLIGGWIAYLWFPALGHFQEPLSQGRLIDRFAGLSHPNTVGQFGGLVIVIMAALWIGRQARSWWSVLLVALAAGALVLSISRASMAACAIALVVANRDVLRRRLGGEFWLTMGIAVAAAALLFSLSGLADDLVGKAIAKLTKSGSTEELTTMTGRWSIWGETLRLSAERPLLGWGPATSKILLEEFAGYTHNLWLNGLLSGGVVCALVLVGLTAGRIRATFRQPQRIADGIAIFIICNGLFENMIFESIPAAPTMLLIVSMMWRDAGPEHSTPTDHTITEEST